MALAAKSGVLAGLVIACFGGGFALRQKAPGTGSALLHLGAFMAALDAGAIATYGGLSFGWIAAAGGSVGLLATALVPAVFARFADDDGLATSPIMEAGRVLALAAIGLAVANITPLAAPIVVVAIAISAAFVHRREATGLALAAGLGPVIEWVGSLAEPGSLLDWLADMTTATSLETVGVAGAAIVATLAMRRSPFWTASAVIVGAVAMPSAVDIFGQHTDGTLIALAAAGVGFRLAARFGHRPGWLPLVDVGGLLTAALGVLVGIGRLMTSALIEPVSSSNFSSNGIDIGLASTAVLLGIGWLMSDLLEPDGTPRERLWLGASGPIATAGLVSATALGAIAAARPDHSGVVIALASILLGVTRRRHGLFILRAGVPVATILLAGHPALALGIVIGGALASQFRARRDLLDGAAPSSAALTQLAGLASLSIGALFSIGAWESKPNLAVLAAGAIGATLLAMAWDANRAAVPDLRLAPRLLLPLMLAPVWFDLGLAGGAAITIAAALLADRLLLRTSVSDWLASINLTVGTWLIASEPWWQSEPITSADWWFFGPSVILGVFGWRQLRAGHSSWHGFGPAFGIVGSMALLDRLDGAGGWHGVAAGAIGLVALLVGVGRRWSSPTVIGVGLLFGAIVIEVGGTVPRIPVWVLLSVGGSILLGFGWALERNAGSGPIASLRSTWNDFR